MLSRPSLTSPARTVTAPSVLLSFIIGLICLAAAKGDSDDALAGVDKGAAAVGRADVSVIIGVAQPNRLGVQ